MSTAAAEPKVQFDYVAPCPEHAPELYRHQALAECAEGLDRIGEAELARYEADGFLAVQDAFTPEEVAAASDGLHDLMSGRRGDFKGVMFENAVRESFASLTAEEKYNAVRKIFNFVEHEPRLAALSAHPKLLAVVSRLIRGKRPKMFQDMALVKPARIGREKPWHQDSAYFHFAMGTPVVGVWIAIDEATIENGCMHVLRGAHREGPRIHFKKRDWQICDTEMLQPRQTVTAAPLRPGGLLFFSGLTPHGTPTNHSPLRRRALQFHYAPEDAVKVKDEERLQVFGSEGKDVTC